MFLLLAQGALAVAWWRFSPQGFPPSHPLFWVNTAGPALIAALGAAGVCSAAADRGWAWRAALPALGAFWFAAGLTGRIIMPVSAGLPALALGALGGVLLIASLAVTDGGRKLPAVCAAAGALAGAILPFTQRASPFECAPLKAAVPTQALRADTPPAVLALSGRVDFKPGPAAVRVLSSGPVLEVLPLLRFESRSPDAGWVLLVPKRERLGPARRLIGWAFDEGAAAASYDGDGMSSLRVRASPSGVTSITAFTTIDAPVFSHLNSYCRLRLSGHERISIGFSPCKEIRFPIEPADYPRGRPLRFAYRDNKNRFHVVEARSGEKGPFRQLASGALGPRETLTLTLYDAERSVFEVAFDDWAAQAGTGLSPTAGWGVPVNGVDFRREGERREDPCIITLTLAATGVGRGWNTVGHSAGTYRNRIRVREMSAPSRPAVVN